MRLSIYIYVFNALTDDYVIITSRRGDVTTTVGLDDTTVSPTTKKPDVTIPNTFPVAGIIIEMIIVFVIGLIPVLIVTCMIRNKIDKVCFTKKKRSLTEVQRCRRKESYK